MTTTEQTKMTFKDFNLDQSITQALTVLGYESPTEIQEKAIPEILKRHDILASSKTGSGKTAAFSLPILHNIIHSKEDKAIILAPTRELALQIRNAIHTFRGSESSHEDKSTGGRRGFVNHKIKTSLLVGGSDIVRQFQDLKRGPNVIIATPGRLNDHITRRSVNLLDYNVVVLDEADRMLDMGFGPQISTIIRGMKAPRQTIMFSATLSKKITKAAQEYLNNPTLITIGSSKAEPISIKQEFIQVQSDKYPHLIEQLSKIKGSVIVFVNTQRMAEELSYKLKNDGHSAEEIHGGLRQSQRERVIRSFRDGGVRILLGTDVVARGLDIDHIECVMHYDTADSFESYIHRIGRTGRQSSIHEGISISLVGRMDKRKYETIRLGLTEDEAPANDYRRGGRGGERSGDSRPPRRSFGGGERSYGGDRNGGDRGHRGGERSERSYGGDSSNYSRGGERSGDGKRKSFGGGRSGYSKDRGYKGGNDYN
jgi:ATP-dependent RNA helicase DeaD